MYVWSWRDGSVVGALVAFLEDPGSIPSWLLTTVWNSSSRRFDKILASLDTNMDVVQTYMQGTIQVHKKSLDVYVRYRHDLLR